MIAITWTATIGGMLNPRRWELNPKGQPMRGWDLSRGVDPLRRRQWLIGNVSKVTTSRKIIL